MQNGFARIRCVDCGAESLLAYSCQTRQLCPSCQSKRAALFGEKLAEEILAEETPHQHIVWTIPIALRALFRRDRRRLGILPRAAWTALRGWMQQHLDRDDVVPGLVVSIHTFGAQAANWHPHLHTLASLGAFTREGSLVSVDDIDRGALERRFQRLVLDGLVDAEAILEETRERLLGWGHSGFSVFGSEPIAAGDTPRIAKVGRYMARPPVATDAVHRLPDGRVLVETPPHHESGEVSLEFDPIDWIHRITRHVPARNVHLTRWYGAYSCRARRVPRRRLELGPHDVLPPQQELFPEDEQTTFERKRRRSWARLIWKIFEVDPLTCRRCGGLMKVIALIADPDIVWAILRHLRELEAAEPGAARDDDTGSRPQPKGQRASTRGARGRGPPEWAFPGPDTEATDLDT